MLMHPRKPLITDPNIVIIQDHHHFSPDCPDFPPDYLQPVQPVHAVDLVSPPSSAPSSPSFSQLSHDGNSLGAPSMTPTSSYNPSLDYQSNYYTPMLAQQPIASNQGWDSNLHLLSPARIPYSRIQKKNSPSSASSQSSGHSPHRRYNSASKPLPTPVQTPTQNSFLAAPFHHYDSASHDGSNVEAEFAMRKAILEQQQQQQQSSPQHQSENSLAPSVSSLSHNSPVTPQTSLDDIDDASKSMTTGENRFLAVDWWMDQYLRLDALPDYANSNGAAVSIPKLNRTISDVYQDELYNPAIMAAPQMSKPSNQAFLNYRNVFADRLQAANQGHLSARSQSPVMGLKRERSPFRTTSPFVGDLNATLQQSQMATSNPIPQNAMTMAPPASQTEPKTMSPKDALLDAYEGEETAMPPLFPSNQADFNLGDAMGLRRESDSSMRASQNFSPMDAFSNQYTAPATMVQPSFTFAQPQSRRPPTNRLLQQAPEFPASLPRLGSNSSDAHTTAELAAPPAQVPLTNGNGITRPNNTSSDAGTYSCTYHGCTQRFETPGKLQRHKREAHRQTTPGGHLISRESSLRNSQAGPHKCERINPSTGKPCNSVFSRPYDLTRHEDTIHNARKQKVRCHLCTEEKTFSRNDALTRHVSYFFYFQSVFDY